MPEPAQHAICKCAPLRTMFLYSHSMLWKTLAWALENPSLEPLDAHLSSLNMCGLTIRACAQQ